MKILALDPGETMGIVLVEDGCILLGCQPVLAQDSRKPHWERISSTLRSLFKEEPELIVLEDYRIYASAAKAHIGSQVFTSELIGAIELEAVRHHVPVYRVQAAQKGRFPPDRLRSRYQEYFTLPAPHARDAYLLYLVYQEKEGDHV